MGVNLIVWRWTEAYASGPKRRKLHLKYEDVTSAFLTHREHAAMAPCDFQAFEQDVFARLGPPKVDGPYILERYPCARVFDMSYRQAPEWVPIIGAIARSHALTSAES